MQSVTRRSFIGAGTVSLVGGAALAAHRVPAIASDEKSVGVRDSASQKREFVGACHFPIDKVRKMLKGNPDLSRASWDWGFGDYESAIGACSHTGQIAIIDLLLAHGARPTIFTLATLDKVDAIKMYIETVPDARATEGPHSISMYRHAQAGKASRVMEYLESVNLNIGRELFDTDFSKVSKFVGVFAWRPSQTQRFEIKWAEKSGCLAVSTSGIIERNLIPLAEGLEPNEIFAGRPAGSRGARVAFRSPDELVVRYAGNTWVCKRVDS